jgi:MoaA/NifB/PqqE/SkfB family radical SAM enzyme
MQIFSLDFRFCGFICRFLCRPVLLCKRIWVRTPCTLIDAPVISLCPAKYNRASCRKAKGAVKLHLNPDGDNLMPCDVYPNAGKVHDVHGMSELYDEPGVIYVPGRGRL